MRSHNRRKPLPAAGYEPRNFTSAFFADRFRIETMAQDTLALYRDLLRRRPGRPT
jgi:hypothetical protein